MYEKQWKADKDARRAHISKNITILQKESKLKQQKSPLVKKRYTVACLKNNNHIS